MRPLFLFFFLAAPARALWWGAKAQSAWTEQPVLVDGLSEDWRGREPDDAEGVSFAFANDGQFLYVMFSAHTKEARDQMSGVYRQDLTLWVDPKAGTKRGVGMKVTDAGGGPRPIESLGLPDGAQLQVGPLESRGIVEARIPLSFFGAPLPKTVSVGLEASVKRVQAAPKRAHIIETDNPTARNQHRADDAYDPAALEESRPISVWVRVTLARPKS